jgi:uncharacterized protein
MKSPCVKVCIMDPAREVCMGCARTLDEIAGWGLMSEDQRNAVMSALPERRSRLNLQPVSFEDDIHGPKH